GNAEYAAGKDCDGKSAKDFGNRDPEGNVEIVLLQKVEQSEPDRFWRRQDEAADAAILHIQGPDGEEDKQDDRRGEPRHSLHQPVAQIECSGCPGRARYFPTRCRHHSSPISLRSSLIKFWNAGSFVRASDRGRGKSTFTIRWMRPGCGE